MARNLAQDAAALLCPTIQKKFPTPELAGVGKLMFHMTIYMFLSYSMPPSWKYISALRSRKFHLRLYGASSYSQP